MAARREDVEALLQTFTELSTLTEWATLMMKLQSALSRGETTARFAREIGATSGVSGYAFQSVPVALYAALRHRNDFASALTEAIACGGDTDTVGAITGGLVGARVGVAGIPAPWRRGLAEWPRSLALMQRLSAKLSRQLASATALGPVSYCWPAVPLRNLAFLVIVLAHGFRRLLPPY
jgi:ADP-ribosylglycohydrolase